MRKICLGLLMALFIPFIATACSSSNPIEDISETLGVDLSSATILQNMNSHGGFHGDGDTYVKAAFTDDEGKSFVKELENTTGWSKSPLTDNLNIIVYGKRSATEIVGPYVANDNGETYFPFVSNGYYFFLDRHNESKNIKDDTNLLKRASFNFTIAIYDIDNHILHYYELDT